MFRNLLNSAAALATLCLSSANSSAQNFDGAAVKNMQEAVLACFTPPANATTMAVISARFENGKLAGVPNIVSQGNGTANEIFAKVGVRAIIRCESRLGALGVEGDVRFTFKPDLTIDASAAPDEPKPFQLAPERLQAMQEAARKIDAYVQKSIAVKKPLHADDPELVPEFKVLCNAQEAEQLLTLPKEEFETLKHYAAAVNQITISFDQIGDLSTQAEITRDIRKLGACIDATLWSTSAAMTMTRNMLAGLPQEFAKRQDVIDLKNRSIAASATVIDGTFDAFQLKGIGQTWCKARLRPLTSLLSATSPELSMDQRIKLASAALRAGQCGEDIKAWSRSAVVSLTP